jgi:hypothetical protein
MPRRVPVPAQSTAPVASFSDHPDPDFQQPPYTGAVATDLDDFPEAPAVEVLPQPVAVPIPKASGSAKDGERRRKGGKSKKKA